MDSSGSLEMTGTSEPTGTQMDLSSAYAAPDAAAVDAMGTDARNAWLGNALYPQISAITGTALAAKVTGMLLEMPTATLLGFLGNTEALATIVDEAVAVLPPRGVPEPTGHCRRRAGHKPVGHQPSERARWFVG